MGAGVSVGGTSVGIMVGVGGSVVDMASGTGVAVRVSTSVGAGWARIRGVTAGGGPWVKIQNLSLPPPFKA